MAKDRKQSDVNPRAKGNATGRKSYPTEEVNLSFSSGDISSGTDLDNEILYKTEENYSKIVEKVIEVSKSQLEKEGEKKRALRSFFTWFFSIFIAVQFAVLLVLLLIKGFNADFAISEALLTTYIISVFVETLGIIAAMVAFIFNSKEEVNIIDTLNAAIANYQKLSEKSNRKEKKDVESPP